MNLISEFNQFYHVTSPLSLRTARFFLPVISATFLGPPSKLIKRSRGLGGSWSQNSSTNLVSAVLIDSSFKVIFVLFTKNEISYKMCTNCTLKRSYLWLPVWGAGKNLLSRPSKILSQKKTMNCPQCDR